MHSTTPLVSVIVPVYNIQDFLPGCLDSILGQTFEAFEVLCIDDASQDASVQVIQRYQQRDPRIRLLRQAHQGVSAARNLGIAHARGKYLAFLDGDDWVEPDMLENMTVTAEETGCDLVICSAQVHFQTQTPGSIRQDRSLSRALTVTAGEWRFNGTPEDLWQFADRPGSWPFIWNKLIRTDLLRRHGITFSPELPLGEDGVFLLTLFPYVQHGVFLPQKLYHYRYRRSASATVRLYQDQQTRFSQHISVVSVLVRSFADRGLLARNRLPLSRWILTFLYSDFVSLPPGSREPFCTALQSLFRQYGLEPLTLELTAMEQKRLQNLLTAAAPRTPAKRLLDVLQTKVQNRLMRLHQFR